MPFHPYDGHLAVSLRVLGEKRPDRPHGTKGLWVTDDVWRVLEHCWKARPGDRPSVATVQQYLKEWTPPSPQVLGLAGPSSRSSEPSAGGSVGEGQTPSPLRVTLSWSLRALLAQGDPSDLRTSRFPNAFVVLRYEGLDDRDPGTDKKALREPGEIQGRVS